MRAYYFDNIPGDQRLPHGDPSKSIPLEQLQKLGVNHWYIPVEGHEGPIDAVAKERGYKNRDMITVSREGLGELYEDKMKTFFHEHMHEDEEIRYVLSGSGFFDIRETPSEAWIRVAVAPGDLLVVPAGIYHRFTLDEADDIKVMRLFQDEPKWVPHNRGVDTDANPHRAEYLRAISLSA
ncbi:Acireductone dioxygenase [Pluteus cervinus]|uniref:Acireductone dioxygenase n=1 Tax=Pluteus cervinus TaxID=181527 RepID=A0ACD3AQG7_9AGAR|nr:Acireductone dioxygenase [Pluteus cervinus]